MVRAHVQLRMFGMLLLAVVAGCSTSDSAGTATVFEGARLITGEGGPPIEDAVFVVEGDRFTQVGPRGEVDVPSGATRVDLSGRTVMPAIVNAHVHVASTRAERLAQLEHMAYYGAGVVVSLGLDSGSVAYEMREETVTGAAQALTAGRGITSPEPGRSTVPYWVTTEEEARSAVRELARRGVDIVKIWVDDRGGRYEKLSPALYSAVIDEAHTHGLEVTAHVYTLEDAKGLLRAGIDAFAHGIRDRDVDDEVIALWKERPEVVLVPNLPSPGVAMDVSWLSATVPPDELSELQEQAVDRPQAQERFGIQARNLVRLSREGIRIAFGTDGSSPWEVHHEMADMVRAGMAPADVIVAATRNSADLLGLSDVGTIAAGKRADFMVLDANPLEDITNTRRISAVYLRGRALDREALSSRLSGRAAQ